MKKKIKVGLYLTNKGYEGVDLSKPEEGNPGIGGTQFNFITMPYYFNKYFDDIEFIFFAQSIQNLPNAFKYIKTETLSDLVKQVKNEQCDVLIYRPTQSQEEQHFLKDIVKEKIKTITWIHNTPFNVLKSFANNEYVKRFICVSKEQYDMLRDHPIIYKAGMIYNGFDSRPYIPNNIIEKEEKSIVYIGCLIFSKGFHVVARVWKKVLLQVPDAKLKVIGTGKLYDRNFKLGKWKVADENYEQLFRPCLSDENGELLKSVEFLGTLGSEKIPIMQKAMVGVPNPSGVSENCPACAIEFQACGTPVVSGAFWGLLDTVKHGETGLLGTDDNALVSNIVDLLSDSKKAKVLGGNGISFIQDRFSHQKISKQWHKLFHEVVNDEEVQILPLDQHLHYQQKKLRETLRKLKQKVFVFKLIPALIDVRLFRYQIKCLLKNLKK